MVIPGFHYYGFWDKEPRRWQRCREIVSAEMIQSGWNPKAKKFGEVMRRKAHKLFMSGGGKS